MNADFCKDEIDGKQHESDSLKENQGQQQFGFTKPRLDNSSTIVTNLHQQSSFQPSVCNFHPIRFSNTH